MAVDIIPTSTDGTDLRIGIVVSRFNEYAGRGEFEACMDELRKGKLAALPIENLSMMREINIVYSQDFEHFETLRDIVRSYNETRGVVGDRK